MINRGECTKQLDNLCAEGSRGEESPLAARAYARDRRRGEARGYGARARAAAAAALSVHIGYLCARILVGVIHVLLICLEHNWQLGGRPTGHFDATCALEGAATRVGHTSSGRRERGRPGLCSRQRLDARFDWSPKARPRATGGGARERAVGGRRCDGRDPEQTVQFGRVHPARHLANSRAATQHSRQTAQTAHLHWQHATGVTFRLSYNLCSCHT